jgi:hypothetical protein
MLIKRLNPDISKAYGASVILEQERSALYYVVVFSAAVVCEKLEIIVYDLTVVNYGNKSVLFDASVIIELCGLDNDVVGLPLTLGKRCVGERCCDIVKSAALVVLRLVTEGVEDLDLIAALDINSAVTLPLSLNVGHVGDTELYVHVSITVFVFRYDIVTGYCKRTVLKYEPSRIVSGLQSVEILQAFLSTVKKDYLFFHNNDRLFIYFLIKR